MHVLILFIFLLFSFNSQATSTDLKSVQSCYKGPFSQYSHWIDFMEKKFAKKGLNEQALQKRISHFQSMFSEQAFNDFKAHLTCETFIYQVKGQDVRGFVVKPINNKKKMPVIIYNRGGNGNYGAVVFGHLMRNVFPLAKEGFIIIGSQYRGTFSRNDTLDQFGGADVADVTALMDILPNIEGADINRVGMYGVSRGAMQTHLAVKEMPAVKVIATQAGVVDLNKELEFRPAMEKVYKKRIPNYSAEKHAQLAKRSVMTWVDKLPKQTPILIMHGDKDKRVSVDNSIRFAKALAQHKVPHKLVVYQGDNHGLDLNREAAFSELSSWFHTYL
ncbi:S9 family peptidase [Pseudoalteromonas luteoviolacea]|uniref:Peptidase S9 prolyl oligopeptidase catalytic domain-containing protein n=2 Tax=Pseudoalteromonas luteoviolacea TaxID=43657 RepID=A0A167FAA2_9GAMM|nr:hypothetical protein N476_01165 [Pseudoalteromonas luteoviolacea H33]KZN78681.1 hypothetical protein N477_07640 [Pseudoalteromonas luteoviolacea H33-S]MBQ4876044.1 S9 family peptidase [Pseudoalteromonas luteoviolacea]MBQ4905679.1 S9 family peptidase [Pseudoalteromonas luteoviolacea]